MVIVKSSLKTNAAVKAATAKKQRKPKSFDGFAGSGGKLVAAIKGMDAKYDPMNEDLTLINLNTVVDTINADNENVSVKITPNKVAMLARDSSYFEMPAIVLGSLNVFRSSNGVTPPQVVIAQNLAKKVSGTRIIPIKKVPVPPTENADASTGESELNTIRRNSVSHQQFDSRSGNFFKYITYVCGEACYKTNDVRYQPATMTAYYATLKPLNDAAEETSFAIDTARDERIDSYFDNVTGARFIFGQAKKYIAATYGTKSAENKSVKGLPFPNLIPKKNRKPSASN